MATIKDVANYCGVSTSLVSKALNNYDDIKPETKELILNAVQELGYIPNASASSLSKKHKDKIAIIIRGYNNPYEEYFIDEISHIYANACFKRSLESGIEAIIIFDDILRGKSEMEITAYLRSQNVNGVILFGISTDDDELYSIYINENFKKVILDVPLCNATTSSVSIDDIKAQSELLEGCVKDKFDKIYFFSGPDSDITSKQRELATRHFAKSKNAEFEVIIGGYQLTEAYTKVQTLNLTNKDVIVCANDMMAIGCSKYFDEQNIANVVTGFDGIKLLNILPYTIPTVKQDFAHKATLAVDELRDILGGKTPENIIDTYQIIKVNKKQKKIN